MMLGLHSRLAHTPTNYYLTEHKVAQVPYIRWQQRSPTWIAIGKSHAQKKQLVPSIVCHVYRIEDKIVRINMSPAKSNIFGKCNENTRLLQLLEETISMHQSWSMSVFLQKPRSLGWLPGRRRPNHLGIHWRYCIRSSPGSTYGSPMGGN